MGSYRRAVHHPRARGRALHMVRRHAWQFHGAVARGLTPLEFEPYVWRLVLTGEREAGCVPYSAVDCGPDAYNNPHVREAIEDQARVAFAHLHPFGTVIASVRWYPLFNLGEDTDACGHRDDPDETCDGGTT